MRICIMAKRSGGIWRKAGYQGGVGGRTRCAGKAPLQPAEGSQETWAMGDEGDFWGICGGAAEDGDSRYIEGRDLRGL
jgi:hypothetical protein